MPTARRRLSTSLATVLILAGGAGLSWVGAEAAATYLEDRAARDVSQVLAAQGHDWAGVVADGLLVRLTGTAPSEVDRFRVVTQAATVVDAGRILDRMTVASVEAMTPPDFTIELLRSDQGISLIGLVPASTDRAAILRTLRTEGGEVTDLLEAANHPAPRAGTTPCALGCRRSGWPGSPRSRSRPAMSASRRWPPTAPIRAGWRPRCGRRRPRP
ncbi:hypothetical protein [Paracoccus liaowanqingii]|uniref:hypothetical protein n=1 Tax=Paracoccus liaowanqingii TaxID=2560053 RepID=UPI001E2B696B|nr:hypothetical protein [Paracoccus liaowanqingii]